MFSYLNIEGLVAASRVCSSWLQLISESHYKNALIKEYNGLSVPQLYPGTWKEQALAYSHIKQQWRKSEFFNAVGPYPSIGGIAHVFTDFDTGRALLIDLGGWELLDVTFGQPTQVKTYSLPWYGGQPYRCVDINFDHAAYGYRNGAVLLQRRLENPNKLELLAQFEDEPIDFIWLSKNCRDAENCVRLVAASYHGHISLFYEDPSGIWRRKVDMFSPGGAISRVICNEKRVVLLDMHGDFYVADITGPPESVELVFVAALGTANLMYMAGDVVLLQQIFVYCRIDLSQPEARIDVLKDSHKYWKLVIDASEHEGARYAAGLASDGHIATWDLSQPSIEGQLHVASQWRMPQDYRFYFGIAINGSVIAVSTWEVQGATYIFTIGGTMLRAIPRTPHTIISLGSDSLSARLLSRGFATIQILTVDDTWIHRRKRNREFWSRFTSWASLAAAT